MGCGAILDVLFHSITAAGDGVLIPAPYYPAFPNDLEVRRLAPQRSRWRPGRQLAVHRKMWYLCWALGA